MRATQRSQTREDELLKPSWGGGKTRKSAAKNGVGDGMNEVETSSETELIPFNMSLTRKMKKIYLYN